MSTILLGVTGGIAAYKSADLASQLHKLGHDVHVVLTAAATQFVTALTFETLTGNPAHLDTFATGQVIAHISLARRPDLVVVSPATANILAKMAHGLADDLLATTLLATTAPILVAPAMNVEMWHHPATQANLAELRARGVRVIEPGTGLLACGEFGEGRLAEVPEILTAIEGFLARQSQLAGRRILVTAGGTREPIDPVRYIGNRSSGKMGVALAVEAARRGAEVVLVSAGITASTEGGPTRAGVEVVPVETAAEMADAVLSRLEGAAALVMAAAVADWRPARVAAQKLKKGAGAPAIELEPTVDVIAEAGRRRRSDHLLVGFAAETEDLLGHAADKLRAKRLDLVVANDAGAMEAEENAVTVLGPDGIVADLPRQPKTQLAVALWDIFVRHLR